MAGLNDADPETEGVTLLLERWIAGDRGALDRLLPHVYRELQKLAQSHLRRERDDHTLTPTGLVHEAYLRLFKRDLNGAKMENRTHFFALAAQSMRRVLVEHARRYEAARRVAPKDRVPLGDDGFWARIEPPPAEILALDEALEKLRRDHPRQASVVEMRYFGGLTESEVAAALDVSRLTVSRDWRIARMLLARTLSPR